MTRLTHALLVRIQNNRADVRIWSLTANIDLQLGRTLPESQCLPCCQQVRGNDFGIQACELQWRSGPFEDMHKHSVRFRCGP
jgi:hypothetical protein